MSGLLSTILLIACLLAPLCCVNGYNVLYSGDQRGNKLAPGKSLTSDSYNQNTYELKMQKNCNLEFYDGTQLIWQTGTARDSNSDGCYLTLLGNGKLVIYTKKSDEVWSTGRQGALDGNYVLVVQRDRNVVVYGGAIWNTVTYTSVANAIINVASNNASAAPGAKSATAPGAKLAGRHP